MNKHTLSINGVEYNFDEFQWKGGHLLAIFGEYNKYISITPALPDSVIDECDFRYRSYGGLRPKRIERLREDDGGNEYGVAEMLDGPSESFIAEHRPEIERVQDDLMRNKPPEFTNQAWQKAVDLVFNETRTPPEWHHEFGEWLLRYKPDISELEVRLFLRSVFYKIHFVNGATAFAFSLTEIAEDDLPNEEIQTDRISNVVLNEDNKSAVWYDVQGTPVRADFNDEQWKIFVALYDGWKKFPDDPDVDLVELLDGKIMSKVFSKSSKGKRASHPFWKTLIVQIRHRSGKYRISPATPLHHP